MNEIMQNTYKVIFKDIQTKFEADKEKIEKITEKSDADEYAKLFLDSFDPKVYADKMIEIATKKLKEENLLEDKFVLNNFFMDTLLKKIIGPFAERD